MWKKTLIKISSILLVASTFLFFNSVPVYANHENNIIKREIKELDDGLIEETIVEEIPFRSSQKKGKKTVNYYNDSKLLWSITVHGTFEYGNGKSKCTAASISTSVKDTSWKISNKSSYKKNNTAVAKATGKLVKGIFTLKTVNREVVLSCSPTGKLS